MNRVGDVPFGGEAVGFGDLGGDHPGRKDIEAVSRRLGAVSAGPAASQATDVFRDGAIQGCDLAAQEMTPDQLSQAQRLAREWKSVTRAVISSPRYGCSAATPSSRTCRARTSSSVRARLNSDTSSYNPT